LLWLPQGLASLKERLVGPAPGREAKAPPRRR
jgi:hypothetical protein